MEKLLRINIEGLNIENDDEISKAIGFTTINDEHFKRIDSKVGEYFDLKVINISPKQASRAKISCYTKDSLYKHGKYFFIKPALAKLSFFSLGLFRLFNYSIKFLRKKIDHNLAEGGFYVIGENFILINKDFSEFNDVFQKLHKKKRIYFLPPFQNPYGHIDLDYAIVEIDNVRILYYSDQVDKETIQYLKQIAKDENLELRILRSQKERMTLGVNLLVSKSKRAILSEFIPKAEKKYLKEKGIDAVEIPVGHIGAGLRCIYASL